MPWGHILDRGRLWRPGCRLLPSTSTWSRNRPTAMPKASLSCQTLLLCLVVPSDLLMCFFSLPPGLLQVAVPHRERGGFIRPAVHAAELSALPWGISFGKAASGAWMRAFPWVKPCHGATQVGGSLEVQDIGGYFLHLLCFTEWCKPNPIHPLEAALAAAGSLW